MRWRFVWPALIVWIALGACPDDEPPRAPPDKPEDFAPIQITDQAEHILYTYMLADGSFETVERASAVPAEARDQVIVVDTRLSPRERKSGQVLYIADLKKKNEDGTYSYSLVSRFKFERDLVRDPSAASGVLPPECAELPPSPRDRVIMYATSWCGVCRAAAVFLEKEGIPFERKDVEIDPAAQRELACKALKAGKRLSGVPVFDLAGELLLGFDRDMIVRLAGRLRAPISTPGRSPQPGQTGSPAP
ncbi:MAG: glutaredoxin family protein [Deltaproteobacteria bacterium]|nr:glutaredoxin family protein [Deltaproteobacteria bacterium]